MYSSQEILLRLSILQIQSGQFSQELLKHCEGLGWSNTEVRWRARRQGGKERQKDLKAKVKVERGKLRSKGKKKTG